MKTLVLCNSDWLALPAIDRLYRQNMLAGVVVPVRTAGVLIPALKQIGIAEQIIFKLEKRYFEEGLHNVIETCKPAIATVFTFPWKIPAALLELPEKGFLNFHFGILPKYKGTDPVFWQLKNGETNGGISVHVMTDDIDEGPLLFVQQMPIIPGETYGMHCQRLGALTSEVLSKAFAAIADFTAEPTKANLEKFYKAPTLEELTINWQNQTADDIERLVNASNPKYGGAVTSIRQTRLQILEVAMADLNSTAEVSPGTIVYADVVYGVIVACINRQHLQLKIVSFPGGYISGTKMFSLGFKPGERFS
jgi:methionyl-tRNA formyltransferase